jgi:glycosyltransferase involved in cell wall biosynthesis
MRILIIAGAVPYRKDGQPGVTAAHIVTRAIIDELGRLGHDISLVCLFPPARPADSLNTADRAELEDLTKKGVRVLSPIYLSSKSTFSHVRFRGLKLLFSAEASLRHYYPGSAAQGDMAERLMESQANVVLPVWCPQGVAAVRKLRSVPSVVYHGDIDFEPMWCRRVVSPRLFGLTQGFLGALDAKVRVYSYRKAHLRLMDSATVIANVTAAHIAYYTQHGHPRSKYVGNMWVDQNTTKVVHPDGHIVKIIGHVGYLNRTGATYGLQFLLKEVMPHLQKSMGSRPYEVHIIGGGEPVPELRPLLVQEHIVRHGFVEDLEAELASSDVFCLFNNAGPYIAAYTRHLVAWASGLCLVTHARSSLAIPELVSGQNALTGKTGKEVAELIAQAAKDAELNKRIRLEGRRTFESTFLPHIVVSRLEQALQEAVASVR